MLLKVKYKHWFVNFYCEALLPPLPAGWVLSAFFYGYLITHIPGGLLAQRVGGKWVFGLGVLITAILTTLTPFAADTSVWLLVALRVLEGLSEVRKVYSKLFNSIPILRLLWQERMPERRLPGYYNFNLHNPWWYIYILSHKHVSIIQHVAAAHSYMGGNRQELEVGSIFKQFIVLLLIHASYALPAWWWIPVKIYPNQ